MSSPDDTTEIAYTPHRIVDEARAYIHKRQQEQFARVEKSTRPPSNYASLPLFAALFFALAAIVGILWWHFR